MATERLHQVSLLRGTIDLITTLPVGREVGGFVTFEGRLVAAFPAEDLRRAEPGVPIRALRGEQLLVQPSSTPTGKLLQHACLAAGFEPWVKTESVNASTLVALARCGRGTPVLLDYVLETVDGPTGTPVVDDDGSDFRLPVWWHCGGITGAKALPTCQP